MAIVDSSDGLPLLPDPLTDPQFGQSFDDFLQQVMVGVTGLPGDMVRPRWQPEMPNMPDAGADWVAYGVTNSMADTYPYVGHVDGVSTLYQDEEFDILCSVYGHRADYYTKTLRDAFQIQTNLDVLREAGVAFVGVNSIVRAPSLVKERWLDKFDITMHFRRRYSRSYPILNLEFGSIILLTDVGITSTVAL